MIAEGMSVVWVAAVGNDWAARVSVLRPRNFLELGTGQGASGARIMSALPPDSIFTTINYADGHSFGEQLAHWRSDPRFRMLDVDSLDSGVLDMVPDEVDLLFIDSTHEAWHAAQELRMWQDKLADGAIVVVDDLNQNDMVSFWNDLLYEKHPARGDDPRQGVFRYRRAVRYEGRFDRPERTTYGGDALRKKEG